MIVVSRPELLATVRIQYQVISQRRHGRCEFFTIEIWQVYKIENLPELAIANLEKQR